MNSQQYRLNPKNRAWFGSLTVSINRATCPVLEVGKIYLCHGTIMFYAMQWKIDDTPATRCRTCSRWQWRTEAGRTWRIMLTTVPWASRQSKKLVTSPIKKRCIGRSKRGHWRNCRHEKQHCSTASEHDRRRNAMTVCWFRGKNEKEWEQKKQSRCWWRFQRCERCMRWWKRMKAWSHEKLEDVNILDFLNGPKGTGMTPDQFQKHDYKSTPLWWATRIELEWWDLL